MQPSDFSLHGAVDLGARQAQRKQQQQQAAGGSAHVINVTEETFNTDVVERSRTVPVVIDFWATWCEPCKQLSPVLEKLAQADGGRWVLAKVDVDANQRLAQAMQVQSIPTVLAVYGGQAVNGFMGALPEAQVRQWLDEILATVEQGGVPQQGTAEEAGEEAVDETGQPAGQAAGQPEVDPDHAAAQQAIERGDMTAAAEAYQRALDRSPSDELAKSGLAQVELVARTQTYDHAQARRDATDRPADAAAQCQVADVDLLNGNVDEAFDRLVGTVRRTRDDERETARVHLLRLFDILPPGDQRVERARRALSAALF